MKITVRKKHPLAIRWNHWINFPVLTVMIWSGLMIYWANDIYFLPGAWLDFLGLQQRLGEGMAWHFPFALLFAVNGLCYVVFLIVSGQWRHVLPIRRTDHGSSIDATKYNIMQRYAYTAILLLGGAALITGLAIYKPIQLGWLTELLGGYSAVRYQHFLITNVFIAFFAVHIVQVARAGWNGFRAMITGTERVEKLESAVLGIREFEVSQFDFHRQNRRKILTWISLGFAGVFGLRAIINADDERGVPWPLRRFGEWTDSIWKAQFSDRRAIVRSEPVTGVPRLNGDIGITSTLDKTLWRMAVTLPHSNDILFVSLADLEKLPQTTETFEFKCVEGWSEWMTFSGVRFVDFLSEYKITSDLPEFTSLISVDGGYYVAMDTKSMLHSQTLLCLAMNGKPLEPSQGAPVRLVAAVKYGVKNIKQIGQISFSDKIPADYWAENGYSEYLGL